MAQLHDFTDGKLAGGGAEGEERVRDGGEEGVEGAGELAEGGHEEGNDGGGEVGGGDEGAEFKHVINASGNANN